MEGGPSEREREISRDYSSILMHTYNNLIVKPR